MIDQMQQAGLGVPTEEPIPTDFGDIEDERRRMGGLVAALLWAFFAVASVFLIVAVFGPK